MITKSKDRRYCQGSGGLIKIQFIQGFYRVNPDVSSFIEFIEKGGI